MERISWRSADTAVRRLVRRALIIVGVNCLLIGGIFGAAGYMARVEAGWPPVPFGFSRFYDVLLWMAAAALSLPLYVVTFRKLEALAMILIESALPPATRGTWTRPVRRFLDFAITAACGAGLMVLTFIFSSTLLPSLETFLLLVLVTIVAGVWAQSRLSKLYARAERSLHAVMVNSISAPFDVTRTPAMNVETISLTGDGWAGHSLRSLDLRARSGVSVVALNRDNQHVPNPAPDFLFADGDRLFLLGSPEEIAAARRLLSAPPPPTAPC